MSKNILTIILVKKKYEQDTMNVMNDENNNIVRSDVHEIQVDDSSEDTINDGNEDEERNPLKDSMNVENKSETTVEKENKDQANNVPGRTFKDHMTTLGMDIIAFASWFLPVVCFFFFVKTVTRN